MSLIFVRFEMRFIAESTPANITRVFFVNRFYVTSHGARLAKAAIANVTNITFLPIMHCFDVTAQVKSVPKALLAQFAFAWR